MSTPVSAALSTPEPCAIVPDPCPRSDDMAARAIGSGTISFGLVAIPVKLYSITPVVESDISFRATASVFINMKNYDEFFEKKCLRILGNAYHAFIEDNLYDLASLCASELSGICEAAIEHDRDECIDLILIHLNTFYRISLKN